MQVPHAPLSLQHQVKSLYHRILQQLVSPLIELSPDHTHPDLRLQNDLLLALFWLHTVHNPGDLKSVLTGM